MLPGFSLNSTKIRGLICVLGGFMVHLVLGTLYCWANITLYVTSYLRAHNMRSVGLETNTSLIIEGSKQFLVKEILSSTIQSTNSTNIATSIYESSITYDDTLSVYATSLFCQGMMMYVGGRIQSIFNTCTAVAIGGSLIVLGTLLSSLATTLTEIIITQGVMFGLGIGICYTSPITCSVNWFPHRKALITGTIVAGFGGGALIFGLIAIKVVNPYGHDVDKDGPNKGYFPINDPVIDRVPLMYRVLAAIYFVFFALSILFLKDRHGKASYSILDMCQTCIRGISQPLSSYTALDKTEHSKTDSSTHGEKIDREVELTITNIIHTPRNRGTTGHLYSEMHSNSELDTESIVCNNDNNNNIEERGNNNDSDVNSIIINDNSNSNSSNNCNERSNGIFKKNNSSNNIYNNENNSNNNNNNNNNCHNSNDSLKLTNDDDYRKAESVHSLYEYSPKEIIVSSLAWQIAFSFVCTTIGGMYIAGTFKTYFTAHLTESPDHKLSKEQFLSQIASTAAIFNAVGRIFWGYIADHFGSLHVLIVMSFAFVFIIYFLPYSVDESMNKDPASTMVFFIFALFFFEGCNFALYLPVTIQVFGEKFAGSNYGLIFSVYSACVMMNIMILSHFRVPFQEACGWMALVTFFGFCSLLILKVRLHLIENSRKSLDH